MNITLSDIRILQQCQVAAKGGAGGIRAGAVEYDRAQELENVGVLEYAQPGEMDQVAMLCLNSFGETVLEHALPVVGQHYSGTNWKNVSSEVYYCEAYVLRNGFMMVNVNDSTDRKLISERAIGSTFHPVTDMVDHWMLRNGHRIAKAQPSEVAPC